MNDRGNNIAIVAAAGMGTRMQADRAKQMLEIGGVPILIHTLRRFEKCEAVDQVVLIVQPSMTSEILQLISRYGLRKIVRVVGGGPERQDSVYRGLHAISEEGAGVIIIHDAARPFVRPEEITAIIERAAAIGAALMAVPATDTVKQVKSGRIKRTLDRRRIYLAQTPQAFLYSIIREAYDKANADGFMATDDAQLVERLGRRVSIVEGSPYNIKITRPLDLRLAEAIHKNYFDEDESK